MYHPALHSEVRRHLSAAQRPSQPQPQPPQLGGAPAAPPAPAGPPGGVAEVEPLQRSRSRASAARSGSPGTQIDGEARTEADSFRLGTTEEAGGATAAEGAAGPPDLGGAAPTGTGGAVAGGAVAGLPSRANSFAPRALEPEPPPLSAETAQARRDLLSSVAKFVTALDEAARSAEGGVELSAALVRESEIEPSPQGYEAAASNHTLVERFEAVLEGWCARIEALLSDDVALAEAQYSLSVAAGGGGVVAQGAGGGGGSSAEMAGGGLGGAAGSAAPKPGGAAGPLPNPADDASPASEIAYWRSRMTKFNSLVEQMRGEDCRVVVGVLSAGSSRALRRWRALDASITDAANEAKDNAKYLSTLEQHLEPIERGSPREVLGALPGLLATLRMIHTISRHYNTAERMSTLLRKVSNAVVANCVSYVRQGGPVWQSDLRATAERLRECIDVSDAYAEHYRATRDALLASNPEGRQFDFDEGRIFGRLDLFCRRAEKLIEMIRTIDQFSKLERHRVEGMDALMEGFRVLYAYVRSRPYDPLDYGHSQFDRDFLDFTSKINELEMVLQGFINQAFESLSSTEQALALLRQFHLVLERERLRDDLDSKLMVVFHNYGLDLEVVQMTYERDKGSPPLERDAAPTAGNIAWARQLLRRVEEPMKKFSRHGRLMATKEARKIVRSYNKIARTIIEFETLWHVAWCSAVERSAEGLGATLLVRHPDSSKLVVNLDRQIFLLVREARGLQRLGLEIPEAARGVLAQEKKLKAYYAALQFVLSRHEHALGRVMPVAAQLLRPHIDELERRLLPGCVHISWMSLSIDAYIASVLSALDRFDELCVKMKDIMDNRIERNLRGLSRTLLVALPTEGRLTMDRLLAAQEKHSREAQAVMAKRATEVDGAVGDLLELAAEWPLELTPHRVDPAHAAELRGSYSRLTYRALLKAARSSLRVLHDRVKVRACAVARAACARASTRADPRRACAPVGRSAAPTRRAASRVAGAALRPTGGLRARALTRALAAPRARRRPCAASCCSSGRSSTSRSSLPPRPSCSRPRSTRCSSA